MVEKMNKNFFRKTNKAQVTIFIILALILVVSIVLVFLLIRRPDVSIGDDENPQAYVESCVNEAVEESVEMLLENGGDLEPKGGLLHDGKEITFLCYNKEYYKPCVNQRPMLVEHMEEEITSYIKPRVSNCFQSLESQLESRYDVEELEVSQSVLELVEAWAEGGGPHSLGLSSH